MKVVALSGGVGGARLLDGLARALPAGSLTAIVNTGDDFVHLGMHVSPDLDTVMYTLAGLAHEERGWGLAEETFAGLAMVKRYGGPDWFALGDRDLATHLLRTEALRAGESLSAITARLCGALGIEHPILPMSDAARAHDDRDHRAKGRCLSSSGSCGAAPSRRCAPCASTAGARRRRASSTPSTRATSSSSGRPTRTSRSIPSSASTACARRSRASPSSRSAPSWAGPPSRAPWRR